MTMLSRMIMLSLCHKFMLDEITIKDTYTVHRPSYLDRLTYTKSVCSQNKGCW